MNNNIPNGTLGGDGWEIAEAQPPARGSAAHETLFSQGNGYLGLRGNFEEPFTGAGGYDGTYINGFFDSRPITYGEAAYGYAKNTESMLNLPDGKRVLLELCGERFDMGRGRVEEYGRRLSLRSGLLTRSLVWISPEGRRARIQISRFVSFPRRHIAALRYEVTPLNFGGPVVLRSALEGETRGRSGGDDPRIGSAAGENALLPVRRESGENGSFLELRTHSSGLSLCCGAAHEARTRVPFALSHAETERRLESRYAFEAAQGEPIRLDKFLCYLDSREGARDMGEEVFRELAQARETGFEGLLEEQKSFLADFWENADVTVEGDAALQQGIRYNMLQLLQAAGTDGRSNVCSKGLTGDGYGGHYFWDTETYVLPFFLFTRPRISRSLLEYRYHILPNARRRARELGHARGALFPWRTIDGEECSAYYPAGTAQVHIDADIAHAVKLYCEATGDDAFRRGCGAEIVLETARLWADLGQYDPRHGGRFCIDCVTGPDEYHALVNNNCYTNLMAAENLRYAADTAQWMRETCPEAFEALRARIGLAEGEPAQWRRAADAVYIPYDETLGIHPQDDAFLSRRPWDFVHTPKENYPLLLHYHPLVIYRHNACKQADMVLALYLLGGRFGPEEKKRDFDYYEKLTTHDSSLSTSVFCIMACELGYREKAMEYFGRTARLDLDDRNGNTADGVHTANMAGTWLGIVAGFGGMRMQEGRLRFSPFLPEGWKGYSFRVTFCGALLEVSVRGESARYRLLRGGAISFSHGGEPVALTERAPERIIPLGRARGAE